MKQCMLQSKKKIVKFSNKFGLNEKAQEAASSSTRPKIIEGVDDEDQKKIRKSVVNTLLLNKYSNTLTSIHPDRVHLLVLGSNPIYVLGQELQTKRWFFPMLNNYIVIAMNSMKEQLLLRGKLSSIEASNKKKLLFFECWISGSGTGLLTMMAARSLQKLPSQVQIMTTEMSSTLECFILASQLMSQSMKIMHYCIFEHSRYIYLAVHRSFEFDAAFLTNLWCDDTERF